MELLLIRHGLPVRREVSHGPADPELAPQGHTQAEHMANYLSTERIDTIYTSPLRRTRETATPLARTFGLDAVVEDDVAEFRTRVMAALGRIIDDHPSQTVAVVCHGGVINLFLANETAHLRNTGLSMGLFQKG